CLHAGTMFSWSRVGMLLGAEYAPREPCNRNVLVKTMSIVALHPETRIVLSNISWATYSCCNCTLEPPRGAIAWPGFAERRPPDCCSAMRTRGLRSTFRYRLYSCDQSPSCRSFAERLNLQPHQFRHQLSRRLRTTQRIFCQHPMHKVRHALR